MEETIIDNITIRKTTADDLPSLRTVFAHARKFMAETGNPNQWGDGYPSDELILEDIHCGDSYVCLYDNEVVATFVLRGGVDPTYNVIYDGAWLNDNPYATIHRIASNGKVKGIVGKAVKYALGHYDNLRIDTHRDNKVMQQAITNIGFRYCGIIYCSHGSTRQPADAAHPQSPAPEQQRPESKEFERLAFQLISK